MIDANKYNEKIREEKHISNKVYEDEKTHKKLLQPITSALEYVLGQFANKVTKSLGGHQWDYITKAVNSVKAPKILSIGSGPCGLEIRLAKSFPANCNFTCVDMNENMLNLARKKIEDEKLQVKFEFSVQDLNYCSLGDNIYDVIMAHSFLHHVVNLEKLFVQIHKALKPAGEFIVVDVITKNGLMIWPETYNSIDAIWKILPDKYKYDHASSAEVTYAQKYPDKDFSVAGFEGIRSQDIYPLLKMCFNLKHEVKGFAFTRRFVDANFGPNFDLNNDCDRQFIDYMLEMDNYCVENGLLKPENIFMALTPKSNPVDEAYLLKQQHEVRQWANDSTRLKPDEFKETMSRMINGLQAIFKRHGQI